MIQIRIERLFKKSFFGFLFYKIRNFPPIRLFFDFKYANKLWNESFIKGISALFLNKIFPFDKIEDGKVKREVFALLISLVPFLASLGKNYLHIILIGGVLAAYFLLSTKEQSFRLSLFYQAGLTLLFAPFMPRFVLLYIIYVETGIILFFIIKYLDDFIYKKVIIYISLLWLFLLLSGIRNTPILMMFMPYAVLIFKKGKVVRFIYASALLPIAFYALTFGGTPALIGGAISLIVMIVSGEVWLLIPSLLSVPWVVSFGVKFIQNEILSKDIVETGLFFWRYGFRGANIDYSVIDFGEGYGKIISVIFRVVFYLFFWYVLRTSRTGIIKLFHKKGKEQEILRAALGSIIGFSVYTFFGNGHNFPYSIILYLISGGFLKRACR